VGGITFLIVFLILMALMAVVPQALRRYHIPMPVAIMLVGIVIGPNATDLIRRLNHILGRGYPTQQIYVVLEALGLLGLIFLMALAGMEINLRIIRAEKRAVTLLSVLTFALPAAAGYYVYWLFEPMDMIGKWVYASLFASHSVGIVFPVIRELKVTRTRFGVAVLASTVITDIASLVLLAICVQLKRHSLPNRIAGSISVFDHLDPSVLGGWFPVIFTAVIVSFILLSLWGLPKIARRVLVTLHPHDDARITVFLAGLLAVVFVGELIGVSVIVSAFVGGMAMSGVPAFRERNRVLHRKIEGIGYGFLVPFLFLTIGMKTDLRVLVAAWENAAIAGATLLGLVLSKVVSGWLAMRLAGFTHLKGLCAGLMTVPQLSATLAAAAVALELEMIGAAFFNAIVCLSICTTLPVPTLVKLLIAKGNIRFDQVGDAVVGSLPVGDLDEDTL
jgi:Kef-type K+ transport system membrane component KefB